LLVLADGWDGEGAATAMGVEGVPFFSLRILLAILEKNQCLLGFTIFIISIGSLLSHFMAVPVKFYRLDFSADSRFAIAVEGLAQ
jgi:hypothetical protein